MAIETLSFITGNKNKLAEVQNILGTFVPLKSQSLDLVEIQGTMKDISKDKCARAAAIVRFPSYSSPFFAPSRPSHRIRIRLVDRS